VTTATSTFRVASFEPTDYVSPVTTGTTVGHALMVKEFEGELSGRSTTQFSFAFDQATGVGTYVAMEAFEGTLLGRTGAFAFAHSATTDGGPDRLHELVVIAPGSGSGELAGITGSGALRIDDDGTHWLVLDVDLP